jgi:hypothetical protein
MSRLVTLPVGQRSAKRINDPKVFRSEEAGELRAQPCRACKERAGRELHHLVPRSQRGDDVIENLVGICTECHDKLHRGLQSVRIYLAIGETLRVREIAYVLEKKGAGWLEQRYGVVTG